jgi:hypothetical protein
MGAGAVVGLARVAWLQQAIVVVVAKLCVNKVAPGTPQKPHPIAVELTVDVSHHHLKDRRRPPEG